MELKEAIKELKSFFKDKDAIYWIGKNGIKATQIVLQTLEEKDQRISELEKMVNLMTEYIAIFDNDKEICSKINECINYAGENKKTCDECIKQYFIDKVESEGELKICPYADRYSGDGVEETGGFDFMLCRIKNDIDLKKYDKYCSIDNQCVDYDEDYKNCKYFIDKAKEDNMEEDWLNEIVKCPWCKKDVRDGDRIWLDGECLCPQCYEHKRHKYFDKEET